MLHIENLSKIYKTGKEEVTGIKDINIQLPDSGLMFIMGKSGSGKTTLMNVLTGLDDHTGGFVTFNGTVLTDYTEKQWDNFRNKSVGIVFQNINLMEDLSIRENLALPLKILDVEEAQIDVEVDRVLSYVGLDGYGERRVFELSAGEKQRIAIARAIIKRPNMIVADEITGNLDSANAEMIFQLLNQISKKILVIAISHDKFAAGKYGDQIIMMSKGEIISQYNNQNSKKISIKKCSVSLKSPENNFEYAEDIYLDEFHIKKFIVHLLEQNSDLKEVKFHLNVDLNHPDDTKEDIILWENNHHIRHLKFQEIIKLARNNMEKRKQRLRITFILFVFTYTLFFAADILSSNDYIKSMSEFMDNQHARLAVVSRKNTYTDSFGYEDTVELYKGTRFLSGIYSIFQEKDVIKCLGENYVEYEKTDGKSRRASTNIMVCNNSDYFRNLDIEGRLPEEEDEIVLDKDLAAKLEISQEMLKKTVKIYDNVFKVVGILNSDVINNADYSIISEKYMSKRMEKKESLYFEANNIVRSVSLKEYIYSCISMGSVEWLHESKDQTELEYGRYPNDSCEILISINLAEDLGYLEKGVIVTKYRLPDLYNEKYNGIYDNKINLYDYMGKNVEIVGIYDPDKFDCATEAKILVCDDIYEKLKAEYYATYYYSSYILNFSDYDTYKSLKLLNSLGYRINNEISMYVYVFWDFMNEIEGGLTVVVALCMIMTLCMMISYIVFNIKDHTRKIGILRSIGVGSRDITMMFLFETSLICITTAVCATICSVLVAGVMNMKIKEITRVWNLQIITIQYFRIAGLAVAVFLCNVFLTAVPIMKCMRRKSLKLINDEK